MISQAVAPKSIHELLVEHLVKVEEEREGILREFFPKVTVESIEFEKLIANYISTIEGLIQRNEICGDDGSSFPFVLIGSVVEIMDLSDGTVETVQVVSPFLHQGHINYTFASYLSPLGRELLLKRKGDKVQIKTPSGTSSYLINNISFSSGILS